MGVRGIDLKNDDSVVGMEVTTPKSDIEILIVTEMGLGKRTLVAEWPLQNRGGQGVKAAEVTNVGDFAVKVKDEDARGLLGL
jgi:DNA gyrase subunit A